MFDYIEIFKLDQRLRWIEVKCADSLNKKQQTIRIIVGEDHEMAFDFIQRYMAKVTQSFEVPAAQRRQIEELFEEACMARVMLEKNTPKSDLIELLPTSVIHFKYSERTSFRKSRAARIGMFLEEAETLLQQREFDRAAARLEWVHQLDPGHQEAFFLKVVCLRSWKKFAECVPVFEAWIEKHPDKIEPRLGLSEMWLYLEQNQKARESFEKVLTLNGNDPMALLGVAQAKVKLGEHPLPEIRKAWLLDPDFTVEMVENRFDFRGLNPEDLEPRSLTQVAKTYGIPLNRILERAHKGVLPMHPLLGDGLLRFSKQELDRYYEILKCLGREIAPSARRPAAEEPAAVQPGLFDEPAPTQAALFDEPPPAPTQAALFDEPPPAPTRAEWSDDQPADTYQPGLFDEPTDDLDNSAEPG